MLTTVGKTDTALKMDVLAQLQFEPSIKIADISVLVKDGVVTLKGTAASFGERSSAVRAVKRVAGVRAIADDIAVSRPASGHHPDSDIAAAAANRINWSTLIPSGAVQVTVAEGQLTLEGELEWGYQKHAAEEAVQHLPGVHSVSNQITIRPVLTSEATDIHLKSALKRSALLENTSIQVETEDRHVTLTGRVRSYAESEEAERLAWAAPGILSVDNHLKVEWPWDLTD
ncbi:MAG: BON domain-containing protein [Acidobacteria bacterium]|nr:BON domain-containing protein [Acidobacteriota bacterium]MBI3487195.1 BON domain-containing protein [Acidobacteriota bacterium]